MDNPNLAGLAILVLEDEVMLRKRMASRLEALGADVTMVENVEGARRVIATASFDFALLDVNLPDGLGTDLLKEKAFPASTGVIVITAHGGVAGAVEAMRLGALEYLVKPFDPAELPVVIGRARRGRQAGRLREHRQEESAGLFFGSSLAGLERQLRKIIEADARMERGLSPVLIQGETGTGKTTIARWLHRSGPRAGGELVEVNCSALTDTLAESELFGHERGAFTDAKTARIGLFEAANGGTLFLDELPSLSLALQAKVLKVVEDGSIRRVGGNKTIATDVRILAASNRDLKGLVSAGQFREDLLHRLDLYRVTIPPLRERGEDIQRLAARFVVQICERHRLPVKVITPLGERRLREYPWPGNVRELAHELERAIVFEEGDALNFHHLASPDEAGPVEPVAGKDWLREGFDFEGFSLEAAIIRLIQLALQRTDGNVTAAARLLNVHRDYVRYKLYGPRTGKSDGQ